MSSNGLLIECIPGYFGPNCSQLCRYPFYGRGCQSRCLCDVSDCDYVQGCRNKVSSPEAMSNVSPTELMNQDTSMLSKQTTLTEEYTQRKEGYNTACPLPRKCPKSYRSNHSNEIICTECLPGYFGSCCNYTCRYPNYGKECQSECVCDEENCNHIIGYVQRTSNETFWTTNPPLNKTKTNITYVLHEHTTFKKAEDQSDITQNSTKYDQYSNKSTEKVVESGFPTCPSHTTEEPSTTQQIKSGNECRATPPPQHCLIIPRTQTTPGILFKHPGPKRFPGRNQRLQQINADGYIAPDAPRVPDIKNILENISRIS
uniref:Uncharacterized protein n=1 Tax=Magallana gigas TaxID=29159 RepID=A0A8W8JCL2_MAGGI